MPETPDYFFHSYNQKGESQTQEKLSEIEKLEHSGFCRILGFEWNATTPDVSRQLAKHRCRAGCFTLVAGVC